MIKLAVFDIDRTLIAPELGCIAPETAEAIHMLQRRGIRTAIASGRMLHLLPKELRTLNFDYYILSNGAYVVDGQDSVVSQETVPPAVVEKFSGEMIRRGMAFDIRYVDGMVQGNPDRDVREAMKDFWASQKIKLKRPPNLQWHITPSEGQTPISFCACIPIDLQQAFFPLFPELDFLPVFESIMCDVNLKGISKATGIRRICSILGITMEQTIAFGDDRNDLEMVAEAGIGVAMGNGIAAVKAAADYVAEPCAELGVVKALRHFGLVD